MDLPKLAACQRGRFYFKCAASASAIAVMAAVLHQSFSKLGVGTPVHLDQASQLSETPATPLPNALQKTQFKDEALQDLQEQDLPPASEEQKVPAINTESASASGSAKVVAVEYAAVHADALPANAIGAESSVNSLQSLPVAIPSYAGHSENF